MGGKFGRAAEKSGRWAWLWAEQRQHVAFVVLTLYNRPHVNDVRRSLLVRGWLA